MDMAMGVARRVPRETRTAPDGEAVAALLRARDPQTWADLYDACFDPLYRYTWARTRDPATAADLAAATFTEALAGVDRFRWQGRPLLAWLYGIARNLVAMHLRERAREGRRERSLFALGDGPGPTAGHPAATTELLDLQMAVESLPGDEREIIALHYYAGFTLKEAAEVAGIPQRRAYTLQAKALERLRRRLIPEKILRPAGNSPPPGQ
jgi:RNA polymerase sigma-70 factor (ECF subfamily)